MAFERALSGRRIRLRGRCQKICPALGGLAALGSRSPGHEPRGGQVRRSIYSPLPFVALPFALARLLLLVILRLRERGGKLRQGDILAMAGLGVVGVGVNNVLFTFGVDLTSASDTALIYATPPLWGMLLGFVLGQERPTPRGIFGDLPC